MELGIIIGIIVFIIGFTIIRYIIEYRKNKKLKIAENKAKRLAKITRLLIIIIFTILVLFIIAFGLDWIR